MKAPAVVAARDVCRGRAGDVHRQPEGQDALAKTRRHGHALRLGGIAIGRRHGELDRRAERWGPEAAAQIELGGIEAIGIVATDRLDGRVLGLIGLQDRPTWVLASTGSTAMSPSGAGRRRA